MGHCSNFGGTRVCILLVLSTWHLLFLSAFSKCVLAMSMVEKTVRHMGH